MVEWLTSLISRRAGGVAAGGGADEVDGPGVEVDIGFSRSLWECGGPPGHAARASWGTSAGRAGPFARERDQARRATGRCQADWPGTGREPGPAGGSYWSGNGTTRAATLNAWWQ